MARKLKEFERRHVNKKELIQIGGNENKNRFFDLGNSTSREGGKER